MTPPNSKRRSPTLRQTNRAYPLCSIDSGQQVLAVVGSLRFATTTQLRRAMFDATSATPRQARYRATKTLRQLFDAGYLKRIQVFCPSASSDVLSLQMVHTLSALGARAVGIDPTVTQTRAPKTRSLLWHDFWLVELGVLAFAGCPPGLTVTHWWNDRVLAARKRKGQLALPTIPDALLVVRNHATGKDYPCLIELDLGTESVRARSATKRDVTHKIDGYLNYSPDAFAHDFGLAAPIVVLFVSDTQRRLTSLQEATRQAGGRGRFWFATLPQLRGIEHAHSSTKISSAALQGAFWTSIWQTAAKDELRSLKTRCGGVSLLA